MSIGRETEGTWVLVERPSATLRFRDQSNQVFGNPRNRAGWPPRRPRTPFANQSEDGELQRAIRSPTMRMCEIQL